LIINEKEEIMSRTYVKIVMIIIGIAISAMAVPRLINYQGKLIGTDT